MGPQKKALPKLGQTQDIMKAFVETGKTEVRENSNSSNENGNPGTQEPRNLARGDGLSDDLAVSVASLLEGVPSVGADGVPQILREVYDRSEPEKLVKRTYDIPKRMADKLRVIVAIEDVTAVSVITEALELWFNEYVATKDRLRRGKQ